MKKPVIIIRSHHIGFMFGFTVMIFAAIGVKATVTPQEQETAQYAASLPNFQLPNQKVQSSQEYAAFMERLNDNIDGE